LNVGPTENAPDAGMTIDWAPAVEAILADRAAGVPIRTISARFHNGLADLAVTIAEKVARQSPELSGDASSARPPIVLTGGCFQNALLADRLGSRLSAAGFDVYTHHQVPPGDGGIALGQVVLALQQLGPPQYNRD
jgi:hydrogenase maturation protein HypF